MKYKHFFIRAKFIFHLLMKKKITALKIYNYLSSLAHYTIRSNKSGKYPSVVIFDPTNQCNLYCVACRETTTSIVDTTGEGKEIELGKLDYALFEQVIKETHAHIMLALMYMSGEPLMNTRVYDMIRFASNLSVPTLLSTNGMMLNEKNAEKILDSGLDMVKIAISGFTQETYGREHRGGDIETILGNVLSLGRLKKQKGADTIILLDYILFDHNEDEIDLVKAFCDENDILMSVRTGRPSFGGFEVGIQETSTAPLKVTTHLCDWLWKIMSITWDGKSIPCCEYSFVGNPVVLGEHNSSKAVVDIWNGETYRNYRDAHINQGRTVSSVCSKCHYKGVNFQG